MFGASPSVREQEKGLTSWLTHPKARAHSGDQPLRPEAVVPRTDRRATDPVLLWPLRPEAVVPRTDRRATDPSCLLMTLAGYSDRLQLEAQRCASSRVRAVPTSVCRSSCCSNVRLSVIMAPSMLRRTESAPAGTVRGPPTRR